MRLMQDGAMLRQEPEFADLYFDSRQTLEATVRHFPRFKRRLDRVDRRERERVQLVYDDYRIAVLDDLDTPEFRQDLQRRLARCTARLNRRHDVEKTELALFLSMFLDTETRKKIGRKKLVPLGAYALVTTIYEESFDHAMAEIPDARDMIGETLYDMWCARRHIEDMALIHAVVEQIDAFDELAVRVATDPALARAWQRQEWYLIDEFQAHIAQLRLNIEPGIFTPEEAALPLTRMEQRYWNKPWSPSRYLTTLAILNFLRCIIEVLEEIVTQAKVTQMSLVLKSLGQAYLQADDERLRALVPSIQGAIDHLQSETRPAQNKVIRTLYLTHVSMAIDERSLGPQWQRFFRRTQKSRLMQSFIATTDRDTGS